MFHWSPVLSVMLPAWFLFFHQWLFQQLSCLNLKAFFSLKWGKNCESWSQLFWMCTSLWISNIINLFCAAKISTVYGKKKEWPNSQLLMTHTLLFHCLPDWFISSPTPAILVFISSADRLEEELNLSTFTTDFCITVTFLQLYMSWTVLMAIFSHLFSVLPYITQCVVSTWFLYAENEKSALLSTKLWVVGFLLPVTF